MDARVCGILSIPRLGVRHRVETDACSVCGAKISDLVEKVPAADVEGGFVLDFEKLYTTCPNGGLPAVSTDAAFIPMVKAAMFARFYSTTITTRFNGIGYTADMDCRESPGTTENHALCNLAIDLEQEEKEDR